MSEMAPVDGEEDQPVDVENGESVGNAAPAGAGGPSGGASSEDDAAKSRGIRRPRLKNQRSLGRENDIKDDKNTKDSPKQQQQQQPQQARTTVHKHTLKILGRSHAR